MVKKRVLVFSGTYIPGYKGGGPIRSLENIFNQLSEDIDFYLVTLNRDLGDKNPIKELIPIHGLQLERFPYFISMEVI